MLVKQITLTFNWQGNVPSDRANALVISAYRQVYEGIRAGLTSGMLSEYFEAKGDRPEATYTGDWSVAEVQEGIGSIAGFSLGDK